MKARNGFRTDSSSSDDSDEFDEDMIYSSESENEEDDGNNSEEQPASSSADQQVDPDTAAELEILEDDDDVVKAIKTERNKKRDHPPTIVIDDSVVDICFHPGRDLIAIATMLGDVLIYEYTNEEVKLTSTHELHMKPCRAIEFNDEGTIMFTTAKDRSILASDVETGKLVKCYEEAHDEPVYSLKCLDDNKIVTGDDAGTVKLWDLRKPDPVFNFNIGEDYISDMITNEAQKYLVCAGGDGILTSIDLKASKIYSTSEFYDSELTCLGLFKTESKLLVGSSKGKLYLFNWKEFGLHSDEYVGNKHAISCMVPITQNIVITSGQDGILRASHMFPQRQLGIVGQHSLPVERLDISHDGQFVASCTLDSDVKFWNISYFEEIENVIDLNHKQNKRKDMGNNLPSSSFSNASDFYSGLI